MTDQDWRPPVEQPLYRVKSHFVRAPDGEIKCWAGTREMWIGSLAEATELSVKLGPGHQVCRLGASR